MSSTMAVLLSAMRKCATTIILCRTKFLECTEHVKVINNIYNSQIVYSNQLKLNFKHKYLSNEHLEYGPHLDVAIVEP